MEEFDNLLHNQCGFVDPMIETHSSMSQRVVKVSLGESPAQALSMDVARGTSHASSISHDRGERIPASAIPRVSLL